MELKLSSENFQEEVLNSNLPVLVFYNWCHHFARSTPSCKKVNYNNTLFDRFIKIIFIQNFHYLLLFEVRDKHVGLWQKDDMLDEIKSYL